MLLSLLLLAARIQSEAPAPPYRQPQLAAAHGKVAMVFGGGPSLYFAASPDQGRTFSAPVKIATVGALALGRHRGPRLAILRDALVVSAVAGSTTAAGAHAHGLPEAGNLMVWRSTDAGRTWQRGGVINDVPGSAREGLHAMVADARGTLFAAWLDLRGEGTRLYGARSTDGGVTWSRNTAIYTSPGGTICQCCHPSLTVGEAGQVWVMWRNAVEGSRDLWVASSSDGERFGAARKLGDGTWKINACPMDGGGFSVSGGRVVSAWRRESDVYLAEPGAADRRIGAGKDVALAQGKRGTYVAWTRETGLEVLTPGAGSAVPLATEGAFVTLLPLADGGVLAAWEAHGAIETKHLD
jgi:hypothetical protein